MLSLEGLKITGATCCICKTYLEELVLISNRRRESESFPIRLVNAAFTLVSKALDLQTSWDSGYPNLFKSLRVSVTDPGGTSPPSAFASEAISFPARLQDIEDHGIEGGLFQGLAFYQF